MTQHLRRMVPAVLVCAAISFVTTAGQQPASQLPSYVPDELIVRFRAQASQARRDEIVAARGAHVLRRLDELEIHRVRLAQGTAINAAIAAFARDPDVVAVQPNFIRQVTAVPNDPHWADGSLWGLQKIQSQQAWSLATGSQTVVIVNIDTGVNYNHPDLAANMWRNPGEVAANGIDDDNNGYVDDVFGIDTANNDGDPMDDHGHGTHTAGSIGAVGNNAIGVVGVNWNTKILACKFLTGSGSGSDADAIECFNYVVKLKKKGINIRVTSNSWGGMRDLGKAFPQAVKDAIDAAGALGILNVFAAGNAGVNADVTPFDPASFTSSSIVSVAASDQNDQRAGWSNYGATSIDLAAPGVSILSTGINGYAWSSGTSMAAPYVAGSGALLASHNPALTVAGIKALLLSNVDSLPQWNGIVASGGRLNLFSAVLSASGAVLPSVTLTQPTSATFIAPAAITLAATASDPDGTIAQVQFYANGTSIGTDTTSPYSIAWSNVQAGSYSLTAVATDNATFTGTSAAVPVTVAPPTVSTGRINVALAANGGVATASSTYSSSYAPAAVNNGDRKGSPWGNGGGWSDTGGTFPDWIRIDFAGARTVNEIDVFSVQDNFLAPSEPTATMSFSRYGVTDFRLEYWTGSAWASIPGATVTGNRLVWKQFTFTPVTTTAIRVYITGSIDGWSRLTEVEVYSGEVAPAPAPPPSTNRINVAAAANGGTATASSNYGSYLPAAATNGDRAGLGGMWVGGRQPVPEWLRVDFAGGPKTIDEIDVFMVQDNFSLPSAPTTSLKFNYYGLTGFRLEYWTGSQWAAVPGATVTGNQFVWRQFTFTAITTSAIRLVVTGSPDGWSRVVELEAYQTGTAPPPPPPSTNRINVAATTNGGTASASSNYGSYMPTATVNGDRAGTGGMWVGARQPTPEWLRVDFAGTKTIDEIDIFMVQDNFSVPSAPTTSLKFNYYGLTGFRLEYWSGSQWTAVPGATVTGNQFVWRQFTFAAITTSAIRLVITGSPDGWSRVIEVEAYTSASSTPAAPLIGFPSDNWWNLDISTAPVDSNSSSYISFINNGSVRRLHPDFGGNVSPGSVEIYGQPYVVVDSAVPKKAVQFQYSYESDGVDHSTNVSFPFYPIPDAAITQPHMIGGGQPGNIDLRTVGDRHLLIVDRDRRHLYELWNVFYDGTKWLAGSGAFFDMNTNDRRPDGWTSADAAGLAILPGLVRYDEAFGIEEIRHAFRVTVRATNGYVFPASHRAGSTVGALPLGARLRLKPTTNISGFTPELQRIFRAMMKYGLIVADNGTDMFITGAYDARWNNDVLNPAFRALTANDFDVITLGYR